MRTPYLLAMMTAIGFAALIMVSCGSDDPVTQAEAPADTAVDEPIESNPTTTTAGVEISFANDVQPVLEENCVSCHSGTGPGTTHLEMATAANVASIAEFMAFRVENQQMPPWPLSGLQDVAYKYDLSMTDLDRQTIIDWSENGAPLDVDGATPLEATNQGFPPIDADVVLTPDVPYPGSDTVDDYRCRTVDPLLEDDAWVTSMEIRPDETRVLHHGLIFHASQSDRVRADELDGADGQPGWQCQTIPRLASGLLEQVAGWAPGTGPITMPEGSGLEVDAGDFFVIQWHYHYDGEALPDNSGIAVEYASGEELAAAGGALDRVYNTILLGPVEIPCASHESGPLCERSAAVDRVRDEFGFESSFIPEVINRQCGVRPDDFAHFTDGVASSSCDIDAPTGDVVTIWPHMHELGTTYRLTLNPGTPDERILIDIDQWNFEWQLGYYPDEPLSFDSGDVLRLECGWDRALWPAGLESRYVVWAEGTQDEMCYTGLALR
ncbi:MAG: hypothetical protein ACI81L_003559 [Verrucomicrobiales bacterium]|jgi:hypothetical protein